jgi:hypothetical protein
MTRTTIALALALVLALGGAAWGWREATRYSALYAEASQDLEDQKARTVLIQKSAQKSVQEAAAARLKLKEALDASPEFRDTPVPVPVRDSLCRTIRCN